MTVFITLDPNNRVTGYRLGPYEKSDIHSTEIDATDFAGNAEDILYTLYNSETNEFIKDEYYELMKNPPPPPVVEPPPVEPVPVVEPAPVDTTPTDTTPIDANTTPTV